MRTRTRTAAIVLTVALALPLFAAPRHIDEGPIDRIVRIIKKVLAPVKALEQPIVPIPALPPATTT
jgi:hypothetical protein